MAFISPTHIAVFLWVARLCQTYQSSSTGRSDVSSLSAPDKLGLWMFESSCFLPRRRLRAEIFHLFIMCWAEVRIYGIYQAKLLSLVFPGGEGLDSVRPVRASRLTRQKPVQKSLDTGSQTNSFPSLDEFRSLEVSSWSHDAVLGTGTPARECRKSPYWLWWIWFYILLGWRSLSIILWISYKGNLSMNFYWISMFVGKEGSGFPTLYLADATFL